MQIYDAELSIAWPLRKKVHSVALLTLKDAVKYYSCFSAYLKQNVQSGKNTRFLALLQYRVTVQISRTVSKMNGITCSTDLLNLFTSAGLNQLCCLHDENTFVCNRLM